MERSLDVLKIPQPSQILPLKVEDQLSSPTGVHTPLDQNHAAGDIFGTIANRQSHQQTGMNEQSAESLAGAITYSNNNNGAKVEFDQVVLYVNKIKSRFSHNESVYQTFLSILQTYQKEQKTIKEVYDQVSGLYRDEEGLLEEFAHFLPEASPHAEVRRASGRMSDTSGAGRGAYMSTSRTQVQNSNHGVMIKKQPVLESTGDASDVVGGGGMDHVVVASNATNSNMTSSAGCWKHSKDKDKVGGRGGNGPGKTGERSKARCGWGSGPAG